MHDSVLTSISESRFCFSALCEFRVIKQQKMKYSEKYMTMAYNNEEKSFGYPGIRTNIKSNTFSTTFPAIRFNGVTHGLVLNQALWHPY